MYIVCALDENGLGDIYTPESILAERDGHMDVLYGTAKLLPGAEKVVKHLKRTCGFPTAISTSSYRAHLEKKKVRFCVLWDGRYRCLPSARACKANHQEFFDLFDVITCGDDPSVRHGKPSPDIFRVGACTK